jgi:hypothetical protein
MNSKLHKMNTIEVLTFNVVLCVCSQFPIVQGVCGVRTSNPCFCVQLHVSWHPRHSKYSSPYSVDSEKCFWTALSLSLQTQRTLAGRRPSRVDPSAGERSACAMHVASLFTTSCHTRPVLSYPIMVCLTNMRRILKLMLKPKPVGPSRLIFTHIPFDLFLRDNAFTSR